ncbi:MAG: electron transfer flavoprotein subunit alpha [Acidimicrobiales bacterium mtb01]|nr:electron transfer flavoprotein subunit alpha/FixB family protein [Actinomycetota bacterium]TEX46423.1 MAG: electron transfer flavoprotein subunit alpha [Acidimicrobiales bacterium mtb01]
MSALVAVVPVRAGVVPAGGLEAIAEAGGRAILIGSGASTATTDLGAARDVTVVDINVSDPQAWGRAAADVLSRLGLADSVVVPASPDGRDLAPHLALALGVELFSGATEVTPTRVRVARRGGLAIAEHRPAGRFVATLQPGVRGVDPASMAPTVNNVDIGAPESSTAVMSQEVLPPDVSTMDLAEAPRIVGGGAGLTDAERFAQLAEFAKSIDASMGVTRVITDRGWAPHQRQIGTTGIVVDPKLYLAFGVSGAVQHTSGLGQPDHIISVNTDAHCPMMQMADLAIVSDANAVLDELAALLSKDSAS